MGSTVISSYLTKPIHLTAIPTNRQYNPEEGSYIEAVKLVADKVGDVEIATKVLVQIQDTDDDISFNEKVVKQCEKSNFYDAFEIGTIWLERALKQK